MRTKNLRCFPNPFQRLDHEGVPAAAYPFDPSHSPDRRWVGATVDRADGSDGLPRTRKLDTAGDLTAVLPRGQLKGRVLNVDRAPRKRIQFAFELSEPTILPPTSHYMLGIRQGSLIVADEETAAMAVVAFVEPKSVLAAAAAKAVAEWEREYGAPPDLDLWPTNIRVAAGFAVDAAATAGASDSATSPPAEPSAPAPALPEALASTPPRCEDEKTAPAPVGIGGEA